MMPFATDQRLAVEVEEIFGDYLTTFSSRGGQVRADLFRKGRTVEAHVSFPTGLDAAQVTDPYLSELWQYAREEGFADHFKIVYS
jgi:hypothetical protein